ncbi:PKD domain-containing protein [bacterium]|nr:PKD domain-containing protein [bacterium]
MIMILGVHCFRRISGSLAAGLVLLAPPPAHAENAVLNPGFETYYRAPWAVSQLNSRNGFCDPLDPGQSFRYDGLASSSENTESPWSGCSTDFFTEDGTGFASTKSPLFPPAIEIKPWSGRAMAGFYPISMSVDGSNKWFERIGGSFNAPLQAGVLYNIRFHAFDYFRGADASILNLKLHMAFQNGRFRNSASSVNHPVDIPGAVELGSIREEKGWMVYEGAYRPTQTNLTHFVLGFLKADPKAGVDFTPYRARPPEFSAYYFVDDLEVSCTYDLKARFAGVREDQIPSTPEFDVVIPEVARNGDYELDGSSSRNTGAHAWIIEELDASGRTIGTALRISSSQAPGIVRIRLKERTRYRITLRGGCHAQTSDSTPIHVHTGRYRIEDSGKLPDLNLKDTLSCDPGLSLELSRSALDCGQTLKMVAGAMNAESHQWVLTHEESGKTFTRAGSGNPTSITLSELFPDITEKGTYTLTLKGRCQADLPWNSISRRFEIHELALDWEATPGLNIQVKRNLHVAPTGGFASGTAFEWSFDDGFQTRTATTREADFAWTERGEFVVTLTATRPNGCKSAAQKKVQVLDSQIYVPDAFTPNGDFLNDTFRPVSQDMVFSLVVFDRWGGKIYEERFDPASPSGFRGWDGRVNGAEPVSGVYSYMIVSHSGPEFGRRGTVTLLF